ncbi:MAG: hypothetical protein RRA45_08745 [Saccharolobus sp.]|jgi:hypothetical protein|uniref:hypothetical protein n=1 Tax=Saccharolobus sp. TaxID=2100761 RepID=UPI0028CC0E18|nr:hypothetical protein [Saccharolobus sp.]MDT7862285.1 hypothetical protein [Saccharolobus sp.]
MLLEARNVIFDIFKKDKDEEIKEPFYTDDYGEWIIISHNKFLIFISSLIYKSIKKAGLKNYDLYIIQYIEDEKIKNLINIKGMITASGNVKELDLANIIKSSLGSNGIVGEIKVFKLKLCNSLFVFFNIDYMLKNLKEVKGHVKLLFPPIGVDLYNIPYSFQSLLKSIIEKNLGINCNISDVDIGDGTRLKLIAECKIQQTLDSIDQLKKALEYFSVTEPKISVNRVNSRQIELQIFINQLKTRAFIPLIWDRFIIDSLRC